MSAVTDAMVEAAAIKLRPAFSENMSRNIARELIEAALSSLPESGEAVACPCTLIEQDETCPKGSPSLLCSVCGGKGHASQEDVSALASEMLNIANELGEPEDPFAAWETLSLITSENERLNRLIAVYPVPDQGEVERLRKALESAVAWIITLGGNPHPDDTTADQIQIAVLASLRAAMEGK